MKSEQAMIDMLSRASKDTMPVDKQREIWNNIERIVDKEGSRKVVPRKVLRFCGALASVVSAVACGGGLYVVLNHHGMGYTSASSTHGTSINNVVIANTAVPGLTKQRVELVDVKGFQTTGTTKVWTGTFELEVLGPTGKIQSELYLPDYHEFRSTFQFEFDSYLGQTVFALGQYKDSHGFIYNLFNINKSKLQRLQASPPIYSTDTTYSPDFIPVPGQGFQVSYYDTSQGKAIHSWYAWEKGEYIRQSTPVPNEQNTVAIKVAPNSGNKALSQAIAVLLQQHSDPSIFQGFTIEKVEQNNQGPGGSSQWVVTLMVHHQPGMHSPFNEGLNQRIVDYIMKNGGYEVTGLATG